MPATDADPHLVEKEDLLTAPQLAALLSVPLGWIYAQTRAGGIPSVRLGRYCRYRPSAIARWLEEAEKDPHGGSRSRT